MIRHPTEIRNLRFVLWICLSCLALAGCAPSRLETNYYVLAAVRQGEPAQGSGDVSLEVRRFSVDATFANKSLVYRLDEFRYETDYYHEFLIVPGVMLTEKTREWLADSGLFDRVLPTGSRLEPTYTLEGNVTALYGDFRNRSAPVAVLEIRLFLLGHRGGGETVVWTETYRTATGVPTRTADAVVGALNQGLVEILARLEADLEKALRSAPRS
jgi:cholesterol transport system auxiliary component